MHDRLILHSFSSSRLEHMSPQPVKNVVKNVKDFVLASKKNFKM